MEVKDHQEEEEVDRPGVEVKDRLEEEVDRQGEEVKDHLVEEVDRQGVEAKDRLEEEVLLVPDYFLLAKPQ